MGGKTTHATKLQSYLSKKWYLFLVRLSHYNIYQKIMQNNYITNQKILAYETFLVFYS